MKKKEARKTKRHQIRKKDSKKYAPPLNKQDSTKESHHHLTRKKGGEKDAPLSS